MLMWIAPIEVIAGGWTIFIASSKDVLQIAMYACVLGVAKGKPPNANDERLLKKTSCESVIHLLLFLLHHKHRWWLFR